MISKVKNYGRHGKYDNQGKSVSVETGVIKRQMVTTVTKATKEHIVSMVSIENTIMKITMVTELNSYH
jgi:hypothetical protein